MGRLPYLERLATWLTAVLILGLGGGCATRGAGSDAWFGPDKAKHFFAAGAVSAATTAVALGGGLEDEVAMGVAVPVTLVVGAGKEVYDLRVKGTGWSWKDMAWNLLGGVAGSLIVVEAY